MADFVQHLENKITTQEHDKNSARNQYEPEGSYPKLYHLFINHDAKIYVGGATELKKIGSLSTS